MLALRSLSCIVFLSQLLHFIDLYFGSDSVYVSIVLYVIYHLINVTILVYKPLRFNGIMDNVTCIIKCTPDSNGVPTNIQYETVQPQITGKWNKNIVTYALIKGSKDIPNTHEISVAMRLVMQTWQDEIPINFV